MQDRTNIGLAKVAGMEDELNISANEYYLTIALFQVGYVVAEIPSKYVPPNRKHAMSSNSSQHDPVRDSTIALYPDFDGTMGCCCSRSWSCEDHSAADRSSCLARHIRGRLQRKCALALRDATLTRKPAVLFLISTWYRPEEQ